MINDKELLAMIRDPKTQREGFAVLVSQYSEPLYWKVRHIVLDHDDADDVLQNAFVRLGPIWIRFRESLRSQHGFTV